MYSVLVCTDPAYEISPVRSQGTLALSRGAAKEIADPCIRITHRALTHTPAAGAANATITTQMPLHASEKQDANVPYVSSTLMYSVLLYIQYSEEYCKHKSTGCIRVLST